MKYQSIIFSILILAYGQSYADIIHLKDGTEKKGKVKQVTSKSIEYDPEGDREFEFIAKENVKKIEYDNGRVVIIRAKKESKLSEFIGNVKSKLSTSGMRCNKVMIWGGKHNHLYGYKDRRYMDDDGDQSDYIKTDAENFGIELYINDFSYVSQGLKSARVGFNICGYRHGEINSRTLYAVPLHNIPEETVPGDSAGFERNVKWWYFIGLFVGVDRKWYGLDLGLTIKTTIITEKNRMKLTPNSDPDNPSYEETNGRGAMFDDSGLVLNGLFRLGAEDRPHFKLSAFRLNYDPIYGALQGKMCFPVSKYFAMNVGGYLWKTQAPFVEPVLSISGVSFGYKSGVIINYHDDELKKASIKDSLFHSVSLAYKW